MAQPDYLHPFSEEAFTNDDYEVDPQVSLQAHNQVKSRFTREEVSEPKLKPKKRINYLADNQPDNQPDSQADSQAEDTAPFVTSRDSSKEKRRPQESSLNKPATSEPEVIITKKAISQLSAEDLRKIFSVNTLKKLLWAALVVVPAIKTYYIYAFIYNTLNSNPDAEELAFSMITVFYGLPVFILYNFEYLADDSKIVFDYSVLNAFCYMFPTFGFIFLLLNPSLPNSIITRAKFFCSRGLGIHLFILLLLYILPYFD